MVNDFESWLDTLVNACNLAITADLRNSLKKESLNMRIEFEKGEDTSMHLRKGQTGDFRNKLKKHTIALLNKKLAPILEYFEYQN